MTVYGRNRDTGEWERCRAETPGNGRCHHSEHQEMSAGEAVAANDRARERSSALTPATARIRRHGIPPQKPGVFANAKRSRRLTRAELLEASTGVADAITVEDWEALRSFWGSFEGGRIPRSLARDTEALATRIEDAINTDSQEAGRLRAFLGPDVDVRELSRILASNVGQMTAPVKARWKNRNLNRSVLTSFDNDFNKTRYVVSVLAFGGRCVYCNRVLHRGDPEDGQATAEHLTPVNPSSGVRGSSRMGNMVLACAGCNKSRGNKEMGEWLAATGRVPEEQKPLVLARIRNFRSLCMYEEYTSEQDEAISRELERVNKEFREERERLREEGALSGSGAVLRGIVERGCGRLRAVVRGSA